MPKQKYQVGDEVEAVLQGKVIRVEEVESVLGKDTYYTIKQSHNPMDMTVMVNESRVYPKPKEE